MKIGPCRLCGSTGKDEFCPKHDEDAKEIFSQTPILLYCDNCGLHPLEHYELQKIFPEQKKFWENYKGRILVAFSQNGCAICAQNLEETEATITKLDYSTDGSAN